MSGDSDITRDHDAGVSFGVLQEGHLHVYDSRGNPIAVYAPGNWQSAVVE